MLAELAPLTIRVSWPSEPPMISVKEVESILKAARSTSPGEDGLSYAALLGGGLGVREHVASVVNHWLTHGRWPSAHSGNVYRYGPTRSSSRRLGS